MRDPWGLERRLTDSVGKEYILDLNVPAMVFDVGGKHVRNRRERERSREHLLALSLICIWFY